MSEIISPTILVSSVKIKTNSTTTRTYPAIQIVLADISFSCDLISDRQIRLAKRIADDHGVALECYEPELNSRIISALTKQEG